MSDPHPVAGSAAFDAVAGWESTLFLYHEGFDLAWRPYAAGWSGWHAPTIRMHPHSPHPPATRCITRGAVRRGCAR